MKKKLITLTMAACLIASLTACGGSKTEATETTAADGSTGGGTLVMATNAEFPPYEYHEGGEIIGIDVEIGRAIAAEMGMEFEIEDMQFDSIIPSVQAGKADFGAAGMTVDEDRKVSVDFSKPYAAATQVIIVTEASDIAGPDDLTGKTIGVQLGTTGDLYVDDVEDAAIERYNKGYEAVQALTQGKVDAVVIDGEPAKVFVSQNEGLKILDEAFTDEEYAICVKKGNTELLNGINAAIEKLEASGELQAIIDKYITE
ncbi:MAG: transporter substrate-binding domain-containing protein [Lachnospiraceae bacterium]